MTKFVVILGAAVALVLACSPDGPLFHDPPSEELLSELRQEGDAILARINEYHLENGAYPKTLADAGVLADSSAVGPWVYRVRLGDVQLSTGDYNRYFWEYKWEKGWGGWRVTN